MSYLLLQKVIGERRLDVAIPDEMSGRLSR
jgi:hypothetical protein